MSYNRGNKRGDFDHELASIVDRLLALPDDTVVLPGHVQETRIGLERQTQPLRLGGARPPPRGVA